MDYTTKFRKGRLGPEVQPLTLLFTTHGRKGSPCPIIIPLIAANLKMKSMGDVMGEQQLLPEERLKQVS